MYANLRVQLQRRALERQAPEILRAWRVEISPEVASIWLDANDGESDHVVEAGARDVDLNEYCIQIDADF